MKRFLLFSFIVFSFFISNAQKGRTVVIEEFSETGCGACAEYDSAFQALTKANAEKIAVLNYHCFYMLDTFYQYNRACDNRYALYPLMGYPQAVANGMAGENKSTHILGITQNLINDLYNKAPLFSFEFSSAPSVKNEIHSANIKVKVKALKDNPSKNLFVHVVATENNIDHEKRYKAKSVNGVNEFNHIVRAFLPGLSGTPIGEQKIGKVNTVKVSLTNDEKEINYKEVQMVAFVQDSVTHEILDAAVMKKSPFVK